MAHEAEMVRGRIKADVVIENVQHTEKSNHAECRNQLSSNPAASLRSISELRDADAEGQRYGIEEIALEIQQHIPKPELLSIVHVAGKKEEQGVAQANANKRRRGRDLKWRMKVG